MQVPFRNQERLNRGIFCMKFRNLIVAVLLACLCACGTPDQAGQGGGTGGSAGSGKEEMREEENTNATAASENAALAATNTAAEEINAWGDSITEGYGGDGVSYPAVLAELTGMPVRNLGVGGEDSREILERSLRYGSQEEDILVIQMGDNGGWRSLDDLIEQYRELIREAGTDRYIIISSTDDPDDFEQIWGYTNEAIGLTDTWYEEKFSEAFGEHLLKGRQYLIRKGLSVNGLSETEEDIERAERGDISLQLRKPEIDNTHLNAEGYVALAHGVYELGKELGYW